MQTKTASRTSPTRHFVDPSIAAAALGAGSFGVVFGKGIGMAYEIVDASFVQQSMGNVPVIDVRPAEMFARGHIPGAVSLPLMGVLETAENPAEEFAARVQQLGVAPASDVVLYCHIGQLVRVACDLLDAQGYTGVRCYLGSWVDWAADPARPVER